MLNHLSWAAYAEVIMLLLVIYYVFVIVRFYGADLLRLTGYKTGEEKADQNLPEQLIYQGNERQSSDLIAQEIFTNDNPYDDQQEVDELIYRIKQVIKAASNNTYAPGALESQLQSVFKAHPALSISSHRHAINELVVSECQRTGTAELGEDEVDRWWAN